MKITIITPTYNCKKLISKTIESIQSQGFKNLEHIIIDGASNDGTLEVIQDYAKEYSNIVVFSEPDEGIYYAMNKGIFKARGNIVGILNAGDFYTSNDVLEKVEETFKVQQVSSIYADIKYISDGEDGATVRYWKSGPFNLKRFYNGWMPPHPTFFVKKRIYEKYGVFDTDLGISADYELMLRFLLKKKITTYYLPEVLVKMPIGGASNGSLRKRLTANLEDRRAWIKNELNPRFYTVTWKPLSKIRQFFVRKKD